MTVHLLGAKVIDLMREWRDIAFSLRRKSQLPLPSGRK
jgi:hypothetical protein